MSTTCPLFPSAANPRYVDDNKFYKTFPVQQRASVVEDMNQDLSKIRNWCFDNRRHLILGDSGATSRDDATFSRESLLQELKSPWELILTEPVPEVVEFRPEDLAEKYFLPNLPNEIRPLLELVR